MKLEEDMGVAYQGSRGMSVETYVPADLEAWICQGVWLVKVAIYSFCVSSYTLARQAACADII